MKRDQIYNVISDLAKSQGFYGRVLSAIDSMDETSLDEFYTELENANFKTPVDLVMYFEC